MHDDPRLPLTPLTMAILLSLAEEDRHGYALMRSIEAQTNGNLKPGTGSLYAALQRLMDDKLIVEALIDPDTQGDRRRRVYGLTDAGRELGKAEAARMLHVLKIAHRHAMAPTPVEEPGG